MSIDKSTFCVHPFSQVAPKTFEADGSLRTFWPCCMMGNDVHQDSNVLQIEGDVSQLTPLEMFNHPRMEKLRQNLKNGIRDSACKVCWEMEDRGVKSFRQDAQVDDDEAQKLADNPKLEIIDTHVNNSCNLRCRMCDPSASSQLKKDTNFFKKEGLIPSIDKAVDGRWAVSPHSWKMDNVKQWHWIHNNTDKFSILKLAGGEPFYNPHVIKFLQKAIDEGNSKNIQLEFHTNGTLFDDEICSMLKEFKTNLNFSIDGHGKVYEYIRHPMSWKQLDSSLRKYIDACKPRHIHISFIPMLYNIYNIPDFIEWCHSLPCEAIVHWAEVYPFDRGVALKHLPVDILEDALTDILKLNQDTEKLVNLIDDAVLRNKCDKAKALLEVGLFDKSRQQNYKDYLHSNIVDWLQS